MEKSKVTKIWSPQIDIRNRIADAIEKGRLVSGDKMPAYASIAKQELCSVNDVKNAYKILIAEGYVRKDGKKFKVVGKKRNIKTNVKEVHNEEKKPAEQKKVGVKRMKLEERAYEEIINIINSLHPGDMLPTYQELSKKIGCSDYTTYQALKKIKATGLIELNGKGGVNHRFIIKDNTSSKTKVKVDNVPGTAIEPKSSAHHVSQSTTKTRKKKNVGMEFKIISKVPHVIVAVSQTDDHGFVIHVDEAEWHR